MTPKELKELGEQLRCENCFFFGAYTDKDSDGKWGVCQYDPPVPPILSYLRMEDIRSIFGIKPNVHFGSFCSKFELKEF